jgi:hypothetical protein
MRSFAIALVVSSLACALALSGAACHDRTANDVQSADGGASRDGGRLHMIVDVTVEGAPKVEGTMESSFVELRADPTTPFFRLAEGVDTAKHLGGSKFMINLGDRRTKPFTPPPFDASGATQERDAVTLDDAGAVSVNGTKVASAAAAREAIGGDASTRAITLGAPRMTKASTIVDLLAEVGTLGRPIVFAPSAR